MIKIDKFWEEDLANILSDLIEQTNIRVIDKTMTYDTKESLSKDFAHRIRLWMNYPYGDIMSFEEFLYAVRHGGFIDYDGQGYFIDDTTGEEIKGIRCDVEWLINNKPENSNHIMWFNK